MIEKAKQWLDDLTDSERYIVFGGGAALIGLTVYLARRDRVYSSLVDFDHGLKYQPNEDITDAKGIRAIPVQGFDYFSDTANIIPAMAFRWSDELRDYEFFSLSFTPRRASDVEPEPVTSYLLSMQQTYESGSAYICDEDIKNLISLGIVPSNFDFSKAAFNFSNNTLNHFLIGYSDPYLMRTNRDPVKVITPVWGVSFGSAFDTSSAPNPRYSERDLRQIYKYSAQMLNSEFMLTRGDFGCASKVGEHECAFERILLMNCLLSRWDIKKAKIDPNIEFKSIFYGPGQQWNPSDYFKSLMEGSLTPKAELVYNKFIKHQFWGMPTIGYSTTNFIHPYSMATVDKNGKRITENPEWIKTTDTQLGVYPALHPIRVGEAIASDNSKTFR